MTLPLRGCPLDSARGQSCPALVCKTRYRQELQLPHSNIVVERVSGKPSRFQLTWMQMLQVLPEQLWHIVSHLVWILCKFILWASLLAHKAREQRVANVCPVSRDRPGLCASRSTLCMKFSYLMSCKLQCWFVRENSQWDMIYRSLTGLSSICFTCWILIFQLRVLLSCVGLQQMWLLLQIGMNWFHCQTKYYCNSVLLTGRYKVPINCLASFLFVFFFTLIMSLGTIILCTVTL